MAMPWMNLNQSILATAAPQWRRTKKHFLRPQTRTQKRLSKQNFFFDECTMCSPSRFFIVYLPWWTGGCLISRSFLGAQTVGDAQMAPRYCDIPADEMYEGKSSVVTICEKILIAKYQSCQSSWACLSSAFHRLKVIILYSLYCSRVPHLWLKPPKVALQSNFVTLVVTRI